METVEKSKLIRIDKIGIKNTKQGLQGRADLLNKFVENSEKTLKTALTDKEKINLKDQGINFVMQLLKPKFKFPEADDAFNLQALGIDLTPIQNYWKQNANRWKALPVEIDKGNFMFPDMDNLPEIKKHYYYAKNERQEKAFEDATEICKALNKLLDKGFMIGGKGIDISHGFKYVRYGTETNVNGINNPFRFFPKEWEILDL